MNYQNSDIPSPDFSVDTLDIETTDLITEELEIDDIDD